MTWPPPATRVGPRLRLVPPRPQDETEFLELSRHSRPFHRGRAAPAVTPAQFARYLERCRRPDFVGLLLRRRSDDAILGALEISQIIQHNFRSAYLGYQIGAPFARQGYMREGLELALHYAFVTLHLHRLEANIQPSNRASVALVAGLGFQREGYSRRYLKIAGRWRDHERWAILAEDRVAARARRPVATRHRLRPAPAKRLPSKSQ